MQARFFLLPALLTLACGCAAAAPSDYPSALPGVESEEMAWERQRCERWGGYWNRTAGVCESQHGGR
jgi:hypothetical protein